MFKNKSHSKNERVIVDGGIVDIATLRDEASRAGTRFWVLLVLVSLISSMVVPYLSMASIVAEDSRIFNSDMVIPGYSMGGIDLAAYGVDINSWGQSATQSESNPHIVQSTYGYWTKKRAENASRNLVASAKADKQEGDLSNFSIQDSMMSEEEKAKGWIGITRDGGEGIGLSNFQSTKSGIENTDRKTYSEAVAPYRTQEDWSFWDSRSVGGTETNMLATIYPDFVIFGWNAQTKTARVLSNPDSINNPASSEASNSVTQSVSGTMAVPHYVPVSTLFEEFGLDDTVMNKDSSKGMNDMDALLDAIVADARKHDGKSPILNKIVENKDNKPEYDLLIGTHYENLNGSNSSQEPSSDAWNPYPYSMVFSAATSRGTVVSSIYNNTEAYVYFSPNSVYNSYMNLRAEYDELVKANATTVSDEHPDVAFQLGYYLAGMSILEAYLNEALPQDMTRGYVGPAEGNPIATEKLSLADEKKLDTRSSDSGTVSALFKDSLSTVDGDPKTSIGFKSVAYSQLMYDFADAAIVKHKMRGEPSRLGMTSAIMNTLSTYGYGTKDAGNNVNTTAKSAGQGPNRGMTRLQNMARVTSFGPYSNAASSLDVSDLGDKDDPLSHPDVANIANTGMYIPVYYPIQQHEMPIAEMAYRFQVVSDLPYETATYELAIHGFISSVTLSYDNNAIEDLATTKNYYNKAASLSQQLNDIDGGTAGLELSGYDAGKSIILDPTADRAMVGEQMTKAFSDEKDVTTRVDNAFTAFKQGRMNADNVHDLIDVVRAIPGIKYETYMRYFNPLKSAGGADDLFLARVTPAQTPYMPKMLTTGYESAGGTTNNASVVRTSRANFDYFSIPSFGPCFAAKTADTTYYGTLNYELRPFYMEGFLSNLPANANIPALEKYEVVSDQISSAKKSSKKSSSGSSNWGERIIDAAKLLLGKPWNETNWVDPGMCMTEAEYKGKPEDVTGVLCSGLVNWSYWHAIGVDMKGSSGWLGGCASNAPEVKFSMVPGFTSGMTTVPSGAQPGDLIETATHVMIYEGERDGKQMMIEAGGSSGDVHETEVRMPDRGNPILGWSRYDGPTTGGDLASIGGSSSSSSSDSSDEEEEESICIEDLKDKITTIYILAKRLSFAMAYGKMMDAQDGGEATVSLGALDAAGLQGNVTVSARNIENIKAALKPNNANSYLGALTDDGHEGVSSKKTNKTVQKGKKKGSLASGTAGKIIDFARSQIGVPYNYDGSWDLDQPNAQMACNGLTRWAYDAAGISIPAGSIDQMTTLPNITSTGKVADLKPGDIVCFDDVGRRSDIQYPLTSYRHVAIYAGNGEIIEEVPPACISRQISDGEFSFGGSFGNVSSSSKVSTVITSTVAGLASDFNVASMLVQVDSGDFIATTSTDGMSQTTTWYDDGNGTTTAVAYVNTDSGWVAQAESLQTSGPGAQVAGDGAEGGAISSEPVNGLPMYAKAEDLTQHIPSTPPSSLASGYDTTTPALTNPADSTKNADKGSAGTGKNGEKTGNSPTGGSPSDGAPDVTEGSVAEDNSPYADNGGEADQIYIKDHLASKGYIKATDAQWKEMGGKHGIADSISFHIPSDMTFTANGGFDYVMQQFGQKHILSDEVLGKKVIWCKESNGYAFVTDVKTVLSGLYNDAYNSLLVPSGTYYWDSAKNIASFAGDADGIDVKDDEKLEYNTVAMEYARAGNAGTAKEVIDEYCQEAFGDAAEIWKNMAALNDELPQQMQNVLAWADTQTVNESEANYAGDDTEANLIITIGNKRAKTPSIGIIRSLDDLLSAQFEIADNNGDWVAIPVTTDGEQSEDDLQARMVRGVAGTTYTASGSLAAYTITATVGRIDRLVTTNASNSSIPYSGICSGNLMAGTDRYAQLQSHSIDHEGISSGLSGDLRNRSRIGTDITIASSTTDLGTQQAISKVANLTSEFASSAVPEAVDNVTTAFASALPDNGTSKSLKSELSHASTFLGSLSSPSSKTMAMTSTFDSTTMNRRSAAAQTIDNAGYLVATNGSLAYTSAGAADGGLTANRELAKSLVDGTFSDAYAVIQSISLLMVLAFLMVIAFKNFVGYTTGKEKEYIEAQTKLKTVLPRALIAVAMIGLPPMGGGTGFPGGCYLLLQIINAIMDATLGVFTQGASTGDLLDQIRICLTTTDKIVWPWDIDLFAIVINLFATALFSIGAAIVILLVFVTDLLLFAFWALGPVMWAFYTWPYSNVDRPKGNGMLDQMLNKMTGKMGIKAFSGKSIGNEAPSGWVLGYIRTMATIAGWNIMFWIAGTVFTKLRGGSTAPLSTSGGNGKLEAYQIVNAEDVWNGSAGFFDTPAGGLILVILFLFLVYFMFLMLKNSATGAAGLVYKGVGGSIGIMRDQIAHNIGDLSTVDKSTREKRLSENVITQHMSEERRKKLATAMTSNAAVKVGHAARLMDAGAHDIGRRMNRGAEYLSKPLAERGESSGAFDDILTLTDEVKTVTDSETGQPTMMETGRKTIIATAALVSAKNGVTGLLPTNRKALQKKRDNAEEKIAEIDGTDYRHGDLKQLRALQGLDSGCLDHGRLDKAKVGKEIAETVAKLEAAQKAVATKPGLTKWTDKSKPESDPEEEVRQYTSQLSKQLSALSTPKDEDPLDAERFLALDAADKAKTLNKALAVTNKKFFAGSSTSGATRTRNYAQELLESQTEIQETHDNLMLTKAAYEAIRDSADFQLETLTGTETGNTGSGNTSTGSASTGSGSTGPISPTGSSTS